MYPCINRPNNNQLITYYLPVAVCYFLRIHCEYYLQYIYNLPIVDHCAVSLQKLMEKEL